MNDETKKDPIPPTDPTADELVVISLHQQIQDLKNREIQLEYRAAGMGDMARMNAASTILGSMIAAGMGEDLDDAITGAVDTADKLIQHYQDIIEQNEVEYQQKLAAQQEANKNEMPN